MYCLLPIAEINMSPAEALCNFRLSHHSVFFIIHVHGSWYSCPAGQQQAWSAPNSLPQDHHIFLKGALSSAWLSPVAPYCCEQRTVSMTPPPSPRKVYASNELLG